MSFVLLKNSKPCKTSKTSYKKGKAPSPSLTLVGCHRGHLNWSTHRTRPRCSFGGWVLVASKFPRPGFVSWEAVRVQMTLWPMLCLSIRCWRLCLSWFSRKDLGNAVVALADMVLSFQPVERPPPKAQVQIKVKHPRSVLASPARAVLSAMHARLVNLAA